MSRLQNIAKSRLFTPKLLGIGLTLLVLLLYIVGNPLLDTLELKTYDMRVLNLASAPPDEKIAIAAIDEKSLAALGRWPWSRDTVARVVERLDEFGARVIVFDVLFSESEGAADERLRRAIAKSGRTVLSIAFLFDEDETKHVDMERARTAFATIDKQEVPIVRHRGDQPVRTGEPKGVIVNLPPLQAAAKYAGHFNIGPDRDGTLRWATLVVPYRDRYFPSGDVQAARALTNDSELTLHTDSDGVNALVVGGQTIASDNHGRALIRYYGPERSFTTFSIADMFDPRFDARVLKDRIVLIGATAKGIGDIRVTPYSPAFPGVEVRATIIQNILRNDFIRHPGWMAGLEMALLLILGIALSLILPRLNLTTASALVAALAAVYLIGGFYLFTLQHLWLNLIYPTFLLVLLFVSTTLVQYFLTDTERRRIKSAFQHYVPAKLVDEITQNIESLKLGGEKRELTVLFSDVRGFTTLAETLEPEELVRLLNMYLTRMTAQVFRHDGLLDKYMGDAIMAVYGAPIPRPDHAVAACHTALDMVRELRALQQQWQNEQRPMLDIGIGINTGPMIVGNMGSEDRFDYTVIGDAVNLGSRIEHLNKRYGTHVIISEFTYNQVRDAFQAVREIDVARVRGREAPVRVYELIPDDEYPNLDWLEDFARARDCFHRGDAAKARGLFDQLVKAVNDPVSRYYLERIQARG